MEREYFLLKFVEVVEFTMIFKYLPTLSSSTGVIFEMIWKFRHTRWTDWKRFQPIATSGTNFYMRATWDLSKSHLRLASWHKGFLQTRIFCIFYLVTGERFFSLRILARTMLTPTTDKISKWDHTEFGCCQVSTWKKNGRLRTKP